MLKDRKVLFRITALIATLLMMLSLFACSNGGGSSSGSLDSGSNLDKQLQDACDYIEEAHDGMYRAGESGSDWSVLVYARAERDFDYKGYLEDMEKYVTSQYQTDEKLDYYKPTEWHHACLAIEACGGDPEHFGKNKKGKPVNLVADGTYNWSQTDELSEQGSNALIYSLIVLDSKDFKVPDGAKYTREEIVNELLSCQDKNGAFALGSGEEGGTDITAMALQGLAPYYNKDPKVQEAVDNALAYLSKQQQDSGLFLSGEGYSSETISQTIMALCSLGIDPTEDERFVKGGGNLLDGLMQFKMDDGSFSHELPEDTSVKGDNLMSTQQAAQAIEALIQLEKGDK